MSMDYRSIQHIVATVVETTPLPERVGDLHPQLQARVAAEAEGHGTSPEAYWRDRRAHLARARAQSEEASTIARFARR